MKYWTYLTQDQVCPNWKDILLVGEVLPWLFHYGWYCKKNKTKNKQTNYAIWYFCLCRSPRNKLTTNLQGSECDGDFIFLWKLFRFTKKFLPILTLQRFFWNIFIQPPVWCFQLIFIIQYAVRKNIFACLFSVHNAIRLHVMNKATFIN